MVDTFGVWLWHRALGCGYFFFFSFFFFFWGGGGGFFCRNKLIYRPLENACSLLTCAYPGCNFWSNSVQACTKESWHPKLRALFGSAVYVLCEKPIAPPCITQNATILRTCFYAQENSYCPVMPVLYESV